MKCPKCQADVADGAGFCTNCGEKMALVTPEPAQAAPVAAPVEPIATPAPAAAPQATFAPASPAGSVNFMQVILGVITKPVTTFRDHLAKLGTPAAAGILASIGLVISVLGVIISAFIGTVVQKTCSGYTSSKKCSIKIDFDYLKQLKFGDILGNNLLGYAIMIIVVAAVLYGVAKLLKSASTDFWRVLSIVSLAAIPVALGDILGTIGNYFSPAFGFGLYVIAAAASIIVLFVGMGQEVQLEGDKSATFSLLSVAGVILAVGLLTWLLSDKIAFFKQYKVFSGLSASDYSELVDAIDKYL